MYLAAHPSPRRNLTALACTLAVVGACADTPTEPASQEVIAPSFTQTAGTPVLNPANGHYYLAVRVPGGITYAAAKAAAAALSHQGVPGHLVTITSAAENEFIVNTFPEAVNPDPTSTGWSKYEGYWIGAERVDGTWTWVTNEPFSYANWSAGEPNNSGGKEDRINFWPTWPGPVIGKWNDRDGTLPVHGYVAEFKAPPAGGAIIMIDDFTSGAAAWNLDGQGDGYTLQTSLSDVLGGVREHGTYRWNGGRVDAVAGTLEWGVRNSSSPEYSISYGSTIGLHQVHRSMPSPNSAAAVPLNIQVTADAELVIEVLNVTSPDVTIYIRSRVEQGGGGEPFVHFAKLSVGTVRIPLSTFWSQWTGKYMTDAGAADIDGLHIWNNGSYPIDGVGTKFGSFYIALGSSQPVDTSPPVIEPVLSPPAPDGSNGWYVSDVNVSWTVADDGSPITSQIGCDAVTVSADTHGQILTCTATSAGGTASNSVTIKIDKTAPVISYSGNAGSYTVDQTVQITCSATDALSGIDTNSCSGASGDAYTFTIGTNALSASATDNAGNSASASASFTVQVTSGSLCTLVQRWVSQRGVQNSLCQQLDNNAIHAFQNHVKAQSGAHVPADKAAILLRLSEAL